MNDIEENPNPKPNPDPNPTPNPDPHQVNDIEEAIKEQREEWRRNVEVFEEQWITAPTRALGPRFRRNATGPDGTPYPEPEPEP